MNTINNRQSPRVQLRNTAVILLLLPPAYIDATVIDLSLSGELNDALQLPRGAHCALRLLSDNGRQLVEFGATVVRHASARRIAFTATNLSPGAHGSLQRLLDGTSRLEAMTRREVCALLRPVNPAYAHQNPAATIDRQLVHHP